MKKNKKVKKINQESKPRKKKIIKNIFMVILSVILIMVGVSIYSAFNDTRKNNIIKATKIIVEDEQEQTIKYTIKIKDYKIESATKEIKFETEQKAQSEYDRYEIINKYERREIGLELRNKKLILTMPEKQLLLDIEYIKSKITIKTGKGEEKEILEIDELKQCLINQGYEIK